jgi:hypothetical protein
MTTTKFTTGQNVQDRDGFKGRIVKVTQFDGSVWYDVKFPSGTAVRSDSDLVAA